MIAQSVKVALETKNSKKKRSGQKLRGQFAHHTGFYASNKDLLASRKNSTLTPAQLKKKRAAKKAAKLDRKQFFFDYNTVEQILIGSAILICLWMSRLWTSCSFSANCIEWSGETQLATRRITAFMLALRLIGERRLIPLVASC